MISESIFIGKINTLRINRATDNGLYLQAMDNDDEVLLPNAYVKDEMLLDDLIDVFIYTDSEDRIIATTLTPKAMFGEFAYLKVVDKTKFGSFLDWGLPKDLFVPLKEQKDLQINKSYLFYINFDQKTQRLIATQKIGKHLDDKPTNLIKNQEVDILIFAKTPLGYKAIINQCYTGMIYKNEIFEDITLGENRKAYVKEIRNDGKIDLTLQLTGKDADKVATKKIIDILKKSDGKISLNYKSDPDEIKRYFSLSKKAYKRALTKLKEDEIIEITDEGINLKI
jgi:predicted RNA-binding protein (virulence factor B family)